MVQTNLDEKDRPVDNDNHSIVPNDLPIVEYVLLVDDVGMS